jgi:alpha-acetolactate decarboxylase
MKKMAPVSRNMLYQVGSIRSLLTGVYEGDVCFDELAHYGNFGLGTYDAVKATLKKCIFAQSLRHSKMKNAHI